MTMTMSMTESAVRNRARRRGFVMCKLQDGNYMLVEPLSMRQRRHARADQPVHRQQLCCP
jgi:hypothetical protein